MAIAGLGMDLIEIHRIEESVRKYGEKFIKRIYTENEKTLCFARKDSASCLAARFAAKEALYKALSPCRLENMMIFFNEMEIVKNDAGMPYFEFKGKSKESITSMGIKSIHLSITHSRIFAAAIVIIEK